MEKYIEGNKAAWEEAFDNRDASWGADITERIQNEDYPFFNEETKSVLKQINIEDAVPFYEKLGMKRADDVMQYNHIEWTEWTVE